MYVDNFFIDILKKRVTKNVDGLKNFIFCIMYCWSIFKNPHLTLS